MRELDQQLASRFICPKCRVSGASVKRIAATGTGFSRLFDLQRNRFIAVSCTRCGYTELYDPRAFGDQEKTTDVLDILFGR